MLHTGWSRLDDLQSTRHEHRAIVNDDKVYVVGGKNEESKFIIFSDFYFFIPIHNSLDKGSKNIKLADPKLNGYYHYPELVLVDAKFHVKP